MEAVVDRENLRRAYRVVRRNAGAAGVDGRTVAATAGHLREHWGVIEAKLLAGDYQPSPVRGVSIPKAGGGQRQLGIPTVQDRLIQQALAQILSARVDATFSAHSYGYRPGRSAHQAVAAARRHVREGKSWVVDLDISAFFDEVDHDVLMHRVGGVERDKRVLRLIGRYLRAPLAQEGGVQRRGRGTPQGGPLTPWTQKITLVGLRAIRGSGRSGHVAVTVACSPSARGNRMADGDAVGRNHDLLDEQARDALTLLYAKTLSVGPQAL